MTIDIRPAAPADLARVRDLEQECEGTEAWSEALLAEGVAGLLPTVRYLVAEMDEDVIGYAVVSVVADIADLQRIGVTARHRRAGVASALLAGVIAEGIGGGAQRLLLEVREDNAPALGFYASRGFVEIDRRPRYYRDGTTAIVMRTPLTKGCSWNA